MTINRFRQSLESNTFVVTCECVPGRGAYEPVVIQETMTDLWQTGAVDAISITDNPGGNPALAPEPFASSLLADGIIPLAHVSCKDRNRASLESQLYSLERAGVENLLCMSGDYPRSGFEGRPRPVFDLDSVTLLELVTAMNLGRVPLDFDDGEATFTPTHFYAGAVVSPFKWTEAETMTQIFKLKKKVYAGAQFIVAQVGYDARKLQEMLWLMKDQAVDVPLIANVYLLNARQAAAMARGAVPGCAVTEQLCETIKAEEALTDDRGKDLRLKRAASMVAIAKGIGCAGVHLGGVQLDAPTLLRVLELANGLEDHWQDCLDAMNYAPDRAFYYYCQDPQSSLNRHEEAPRETSCDDRAIQGSYRLSRWLHRWVFMPHRGVNRVFQAVERSKEVKEGRLRPHRLESLSKTLLYGCMDCGDCGLNAVAYSCPMMECPKCQRNGPCGGSKDGFCEVYPETRYCIWYKAYYRLKPYGEEFSLGHYVVPPNNWTYFATSAWGTHVLGIDGYARRNWLPARSLADTALIDGDGDSVKDLSTIDQL